MRSQSKQSLREKARPDQRDPEDGRIASRGKSRGKGRGGQLVRTLQILRDLHSFGGQDRYALAKRYGASTRTIYRDLELLRAAGFFISEVSSSVDSKKLWKIDSQKQTRELASLLDVSHYLALHVAMGQVSAFQQDSHIFGALEDLAGKIETAVGPQGRKQLEAIAQCFFSYEKHAYRQSAPDILWPLVDAVANQQLCRITYRAPRPDPTDKVHRVLPLCLFSHQGAIYLIAHEPARKTEITLNLHRVQALKPLAQRGRRPKHFRPEAREQSAFGVFTGGKPTTYRLRFEPHLAPFIRERTWHSTQTLTDLCDRGVELSFRCNESYEVRGWVASWGDGVEVLAPKSLQRELRAFGEWLTARYPARARRHSAGSNARPKKRPVAPTRKR